MEVGVESAGNGKVAGIAMDFPASDGTASSSPSRMPRRLRRRFSETKTASPTSVEEIEAKLRGADLRRQKFYEHLSSKARLKPRSPSQSSSHEDDLGQRLKAKLQAAEQKRLSILSKAQLRLAKLDELRQTAKTGLEMRYKKERAELGTKVESRVQQAETNRMLILKAYCQRRATLNERISQTLLRSMVRENKYKERVHAAICQKRAAAEKNRLGLLEAEKKKVRARLLQVQKVAKSVSHQREVERRRMKDKLEDRLQRAKRKRAEYLMQRGRHNSGHANWNNMLEQADLLSIKLARCWRQFLKLRRTSLDLAKAYDALNINERFVKLMPFEQLALLIESTTALQTTKALLDRLEIRYTLSQAAAATTNFPSWDDIDHLLKRVASPTRRETPRKSSRGRNFNKPGSTREPTKSPVKLSRYQVRIVLCAYMILGHPDAVFSGRGECEVSLAKSAEKFVKEFELLIKIILDGPIQRSGEESDPTLAKRLTFRSQLSAFDAAWCSYLNSFVVWKAKDAQSLEDDLVRAACQLELSMIQTCKLTPERDSDPLTHDMKAIQKQVTEDQKLLRQKVHHLSGDVGIEHMECALSDTRMKYFQALENGSPIGSRIAHLLSPSLPSSPTSPNSVPSSNENSNGIEDNERPNHVVRSLFRDEGYFPSKEAGTSTPSSNQYQYSGEKLEMENELIVNEVVHGQCHSFADDFNAANEVGSNIKAKVRETMENAFWDGIMESMKQEEPSYGRAVELMREVRDEICDMAPQSWKEEIIEAIDLEILSQVLNSGKLDMDYLGKILEFALATLQKLCASANEDELKQAYQELLKELAEICQARGSTSNSHVIALIKGLRFVLEHIQALKQEISKARIKMLEPLLKGPAGLDYLRKAFANRYGPPSAALTALPFTTQWLLSVRDIKDQEWDEHTNALLELTRRRESPAQRLLPDTALRTGGSVLAKISGSQVGQSSVVGLGDQHPECKGEMVDLSVRLGLLKLVSSVSGLMQEALPETLKLNLPRLRAVQAQLQKIIVMATSILVLRQTLLSEQKVGSFAVMESMVVSCAKQLSELLDTVEDAGMKEIVEILSRVAEEVDKSTDTIKLQSRKDVMTRMLAKSLQAGDAVFARVSRAVYLAARGVVLGGTGTNGRELTEMSLRQVGAAVLTDMVVEAGTVMVIAATVSGSVHGPWYAHLIENM
ncbi:unnamed protein product [Ilex paraguariensis]|uniref:T-complex protein 11 n=1 Tax=Ilex paraguariensis TaxID=185542 RepID=A0ABC8U7R2_9AQUA